MSRITRHIVVIGVFTSRHEGQSTSNGGCVTQAPLVGHEDDREQYAEDPNHSLTERVWLLHAVGSYDVLITVCESTASLGLPEPRRDDWDGIERRNGRNEWVGDGISEFDVCEPCPAYLVGSDLDPADVTDHTLVLYAPVFAAGALVILSGSEDAVIIEGALPLPPGQSQRLPNRFELSERPGMDLVIGGGSILQDYCFR
jgi:hypothetical protein